MTDHANPLVEPEIAVALLWALSLELSDEPEKRAIAQHARQKFDFLLQSTQEQTAVNYLQGLLFELTSSLRNLSYRREGFKRQMELNNSVLEEQIKSLNRLATISVKDARSVVPRLGITIGGISLSDSIATLLNAYLPSAGHVSGIAVFLVGAVTGYFLAEIVLRLYAIIQIPRVTKSAHHRTHVAWNRYIRESREVAKNFLILVTRLRERLYPSLGTFGPRKAFLGTIEQDVKLDIEDVLDDIVERHLPIVHFDVNIPPRISAHCSYFAQDTTLQAGDSILFSYSVVDGAEANCYFFGEDEFKAWRNSKSKNRALFRQIRLSAGGDTLCVAKSGKYYLVFENPSYFRPRVVTFGWQILRDSTRQFCSFDALQQEEIRSAETQQKSN